MLALGAGLSPYARNPACDFVEENVKHPKMKWITLVFILGAIMMLGACKKKVAPRRHRRHRRHPRPPRRCRPTQLD